MGFFEWLVRDEVKIAQRDLSAGREAGLLIALAASRSKQVKCKVCKKVVSELAAVCPNCGEPLPGLRIQCPNCSSYHVTIDKKGFSVGKAAVGAIAVGPLGLAAGMIGSKDSRLVCLGCNYKWNIEKPKAPIRQSRIITDEAGNPLDCQICHKNTGYLYLTTKGKVVCGQCVGMGKGGKLVTQFYPRVKKLETPYEYREDTKKYRCKYCAQTGKHHYCKTLKGIEKHIKRHPVYG